MDDLSDGELVEVNAHLPEVHHQKGRTDAAFGFLMHQPDPELPRREYPENPFSAIGTIVHHLVGIDPIASESMLETKSRPTDGISWERVDHVPMLQNQIAVHHLGRAETRLVNRSSPTIRWRAFCRTTTLRYRSTGAPWKLRAATPTGVRRRATSSSMSARAKNASSKRPRIREISEQQVIR